MSRFHIDDTQYRTSGHCFGLWTSDSHVRFLTSECVVKYSTGLHVLVAGHLDRLQVAPWRDIPEKIHEIQEA
jgi:hypothetical protein